MLAAIKKILGFGPKTDFAKLIAGGAQIVDVRTSVEYSAGHLKTSVNMPLDALSSRLVKLKKDKPVITCCASGMRSRVARTILLSGGFVEVYNGGSWHNLKKYEK